jgi:AraC-like DNA-binding protein
LPGERKIKEIIRVKTVTQALEFFNQGKLKHPLIAVFDHSEMEIKPEHYGKKFAVDLYQIMLKKCSVGYLGYGRNTYDFQEGTMLFTAPGQVLTMEASEEGIDLGGWTILLHPDLLLNSEFGSLIKRYSFFSYEYSEALHLSNDEKQNIETLRDKIKDEYSLNLDKHSQKLIISNLELILDYCNRYYDRQFLTRTNLNKDIITKFEKIISEYFDDDNIEIKGLPSVSFIAEQLHYSPNYLSDMIAKETGKNA